MNPKKIISVAIVSFIFFLCVIQLIQSYRRNSSEVYSQAMINRYAISVESIATRCAAEGGEFYIVESNVYPIAIQNNWQDVHESLPLLQFSTWQNFIQVNSKPSHFPNNLDLGCEYNLISQDEIKSVNSTVCPVRNFSSIGFNKEQNQALLFTNETCGHTVGGLVLLEHVNGHWKVQDTMEVYVK